MDFIAKILVRQVGLDISGNVERRIVIEPEARGVDRNDMFGQEIFHIEDVVRASEDDPIRAPPAKAKFFPTAKLAFGDEYEVTNIKVSDSRLAGVLTSARRGEADV